jgi:predicted Zn-dependent protease
MAGTTATYYDGIVSRRQAAELSLHPDGLALFTPDGRLAATWPYASIRRIEGFAGAGLAITRLPEPGSTAEPRLEIADQAFAAELAARAPLTLTQGMAARRERRNVVLWAIAAMVSLLGLAYFGLPAIAGRVAPLVPAGVEQRLGAGMDPEIKRQFGGLTGPLKTCVNPEGVAALADLVGRYERAAGLHVPLRVAVLDSRMVNAFALPGGYIYVTRGILALASDTSELAAVLAHEIAHVTLRHARARTNRVRTTEIVDKVVTGVFGGDVETDQDANKSRLSLAAFSQQQELSADKEGIRIAGQAGYDPHAAARFLGAMSRFAAFSGGGASQSEDFLSSHPSTPDRIQKAIETARAVFGAPGLGETDRDGYMSGIEGLAFGDSPSQGAIVGRRFVHPVLKYTFTVPEGYTLQNQKGAVVGVAGDGEAVRFDSAEVPAEMELTDYLRSGWIAGLRPDTVKRDSFNGIDMASGVAATDQWNFRVAVMRHGGKVYRFIFAARFDTPQFARGAEQTLRSFKAASERDINSIKKLTIRTVTAGPVDTADSLARKMAGLTRGTDLFYILNNLYPGDQVTPGVAYKVVVVQ